MDASQRSTTTQDNELFGEVNEAIRRINEKNWSLFLVAFKPDEDGRRVYTHYIQSTPEDTKQAAALEAIGILIKEAEAMRNELKAYKDHTWTPDETLEIIARLPEDAGKVLYYSKNEQFVVKDMPCEHCLVESDSNTPANNAVVIVKTNIDGNPNNWLPVPVCQEHMDMLNVE